MRYDKLIFVACAALGLASTTLEAQAPRGAQTPKPTTARAADGHPDLSGTYDVATMTPLERPAGVDRLVLTKEEADAAETYEAQRQIKNDAPLDPNRRAPPALGAVPARFQLDLGAADAAELLLQQSETDRADADPGHDRQRDGARRARRPHRRRAPAEERSQMDGRFNRSLGGRHARGRYDELHVEDAVPGREREPAHRRALHARR